MPTNNHSRVQNEDRILKAAREKPFRMYQGGTVSNGIRADSSWETNRGQQEVEGNTQNAGVAGNKHLTTRNSTSSKTSVKQKPVRMNC